VERQPGISASLSGRAYGHRNRWPPAVHAPTLLPGPNGTP